MACIALALYIVYFLKLGSMPFVGADEPRYARIAEEMLHSGDFITPTLNHRPWLEKPPLLFWLEAASFWVFGVSEGSARLPVAILALLGGLACSALLRLVAGGRAALLVLCVISTCPLYFVLARATSTDMPMVACLSMSMAASFWAHRSGRLWPALLGGTALGLAGLAKGPVAWLIGIGVVLFFRALMERRFWSLTQWLVGGLALAAVAFPWYWLVWQSNGYDFVATFVLNHHLARYLTGVHHHSQPVWFFFPVLAIGFFPWIICLGARTLRSCRGGCRQILSENGGLELFLWLWAAIPFGFFSLSESKLAGYILPVIPPLSMLVALEWERVFSSDLPARRMLRLQSALFSAAAIVIGVGLMVTARLQYNSTLAGLALALPLLGGSVVARLSLLRRHSQSLFAIEAVTMVLMVGLAVLFAAPVVAPYHSSKHLVVQASEQITRQRPLILYRFFHHTALYYAHYDVVPEPLQTLGELEDYMQEHPHREYLILTQRAGYREISSQLRVVRSRVDGNQFLLEVTSP